MFARPHISLLMKGEIMRSLTYEWGKATIFCCCVLAAAIGVGISNYYVFYDSFWMATILLVITVGVAAVAAYYSGDATPKVRHYCIIFHLVIGAVLCVNLASHFVLSRQISAAKENVEDRHNEENRQDEFKQRDADRQARLIAEQRALEEARQRALRADAARLNAMRRMGYYGGYTAPQQAAAPAPTLAVETAVVPVKREEKPAILKSPEQLQREWNPWLTFWAFADVFISVLGGLILAGRWEWDRDHDGVADHLQKPNEFPHEVDAGKA
jgi:hypothetical protein